MRKWLLVTALLMLLHGCGSVDQVRTLAEPTPDQILPASSEGISLSLLQNDFNSSPVEIETVVMNDSDRAYEIGPFYHIEVQKDDHWFIMIYSDAVFYRDRHFRDGGSQLQKKDRIQQTFSIENLGVTLPPGHYRVVKTLLQRDPYHEVTIAAPFTVR